MATIAPHHCPLHEDVLCVVRFTLVTLRGDFVCCSVCPRCKEHGHPTPTNWIVVETDPYELTLFFDTCQPELRLFYVNNAVRTRKEAEDGQGEE